MKRDLLLPSHVCARVGTIVDATALHQLGQKKVSWSYASTGISLAAASWLHILAQKHVQFKPIFQISDTFSNAILCRPHTEKKLQFTVTAKSKSSSTGSMWTERRDVFLNKESSKICVWLSLLADYQSSAAETSTKHSFQFSVVVFCFVFFFLLLAITF